MSSNRVMVLDDVAQVQVLAEPTRLAILRVLHRQPATVKQVADELGAVAGRIHYHVKELERHGFIVLTDRREKGSIIEKYYSTTAHSFAINPTLFHLGDSTEQQQLPAELASLGQLHADFVAAYEEREDDGDAVAVEKAPLLAAHVEEGFRLTPVQARELLTFISAMLADQRSSGQKKLSAARYTIALLIYPTRPQ